MRTLTRSLLWVALVTAVVAAPAIAQKKKLSFQFKDASLATVVNSLGKSLGLTFIVEAKSEIEGKKINAFSDTPVDSDRAIAFLNSALIEHGVAAVQVGKVVKIVTIDEAKKINHEIRYGSDPDSVQFGDEIITQIVPLEVLDAESVMKELGELKSKTGQLLLNTRANVILLTDTESNVKRFLTIIKKLDSAVKEVLKLKIFRLKHASADELAKAIDALFKPITASSKKKSNARGGGGMRGRWMQMMMGGRGGSGGGDQTLQSTIVRTHVEERTNTLLVQANEQTLAKVAELVDELDKAQNEILTIRQYRLEHAASDKVAEVITTIFEPEKQSSQRQNNRGGGRGGGRWQRMMQSMNQQGGGGKTAPTESIKVTSDERTNSVIVAASRENHSLISSVVEGLDSKVDPDTEVRVYNLKNADAEELKRILEEVFDLEQQQRNNQGARGNFQQRGRGGNQRGGRGGNQRGGNQRGGRNAAASAQGNIVGEVRVSSDSRTNSIVITAAKEDFEKIEKIIKQLDSDNSDLESALVIKVLNADATALQTLLAQLLGQATTNNRGNQRGGNNARAGQTSTSVGGLTGQVNVRADADSNSLVFLTATRNFDTLKRLVAELDRERPQVLIKALIVEVDLDSSNELGVDFTHTQVDHPDQGSNTQTQNTSTDFDVRSSTENGFRYNLIRDDLDVILRALRKDGRLEVVSAPRILVQDNEEASINLGSEVPYVTNSRLTNEGTTLNTIQYRDVGIILTVTPSINPQGLVRMEVEPEISEIAPDSQSVQITEGVRSPVFLRNVARTTITVRDGQTIILGGLIQDRVRETEDKMPILGDIPLLGFLFSSRRTEKKKVELIIFITPYVVAAADELKELTEFEINNYKIAPTRKAIHRERPKMPITILDD